MLKKLIPGLIPDRGYKEQVSYYLFLFGLVIFCLTILLKPSTNSISLLVIGLSVFMNKSVFTKAKQLLHHPVFPFILLFFALQILSVLNSANIDRSFKDLVLKLPLLLLPLGFSLYNLNSRQVNWILNLFLIVICVFSFYCLAETFFVMLHGTDPLQFFAEVKTIEWGYFSYILPVPINGHAPYLSLYAGTGALIGIYKLTNTSKFSPLLRLLYCFVSIYLFLFVVLLSSRTSFLALTITLFMWFFLELIKQKRWLAGLGAGVFLVVASCLAVSYIPYLHNKFKNFDGLNDRKAIWSASINISKDNFIFGVGTGDIKSSLVEEYKKLNFTEGVQEVYNAHNQYLQTLLGLGILGLASLLLLFASVLYYSWLRDNHLLFFFTVVFCLACSTESLLSRQSGVVLFSFLVGISLNSLRKEV